MGNGQAILDGCGRVITPTCRGLVAELFYGHSTGRLASEEFSIENSSPHSDHRVHEVGRPNAESNDPPKPELIMSR